MKTIKRKEALREMDSETKEGKHFYFSVEFYKENGEIVFLNKAKMAGLRADMKKNRIRGIQQVDSQGNQIGHIYTVCIDNIRMFNNLRITI